MDKSLIEEIRTFQPKNKHYKHDISMERKHHTLIQATTNILDCEIPVWDVSQILAALKRANQIHRFELDEQDKRIIVLEVGKRFRV